MRSRFEFQVFFSSRTNVDPRSGTWHTGAFGLAYTNRPSDPVVHYYAAKKNVYAWLSIVQTNLKLNNKDFPENQTRNKTTRHTCSDPSFHTGGR